MSSAKKKYLYKPEVWGGIECTINRVNDNFSDQLETAGHYSRPADIGKLAALGIKALRYPILWERHQCSSSSPIDWSWAERQLDAIRSHGISPIVGLLHHGSGPSFTQLDDDDFPGRFAAYAGKVAARFPWVDRYTPVNEPLTTARFSGLYGTWYPHKRDPLSFMNMLLNQLKGIVLGMKAIRRVNSDSQLIQTEDLAKVHSTSALAYQSDFENERRWLTYDLLCGKVDRTHPLWDYLMYTGVTEVQLAFFTENPCIPDVLGANYYITSERWLDEDLQKYPKSAHGGNGTIAYADVEAVRIVEPAGLANLINELHGRYHLPIAITEAHLNCTREEQVRWLNDIWQVSCRAIRKGVDIRGVTSWALFGAYDWDSLLTRNDLHYESGAYALVDGEMKLTAVGHLVKTLAGGRDPDHPLLTESGWWVRCRQPSLLPHPTIREQKDPSPSTEGLLIFAHDGMETRVLQDLCRHRGIRHTLIIRRKGDPALPILLLHRPWGVLYLADKKRGRQAPRPEASELERLCRSRRIAFLTIPSATLSGIIEDAVPVNQLLDRLVDQGMALAEPVLKKEPKILPARYEEIIME